MLRRLLVLGLFAAAPAFAQTTTVTGTVTDPNSIPYAGATLKAQLVLNGVNVTGQPTVTVTGAAACLQAGFGSSPCQVPFSGTVGPVTLDSTGSIPAGGLNLQDNTQVTPVNTQWLFTISIAPGVAGPFGTGPQTFSTTITISGATQSVSGTLSALAPALTHGSSGGGTPCTTTAGAYQFNNSNVLGCAPVTQQNSPNIMNVNEDLQAAGPNPYYSVRSFGGYTGNNAGTTGSITSGTTTLTLAAAQDFANSQGVVVWKAGPATTLNTPPAPTITPVNVTGGATTYSYCVVAEDFSGGLTACSAAGSTTTGQAALGLKTITLTSGSRTSNVLTLTFPVAHNVTAGTHINVCGFGAGGNCATGAVFANDFNGAQTVLSVPTSTTMKIQQGQLFDRTDSTGAPSIQVMACNQVALPSDAILTIAGASRQGVLRYWIYRNSTLAGIAMGKDPYYIDCGGAVQNAPGYVPSSAPVASQAGYLETTISSGGGTITLTLANAASTTATTQTVLHDNAKPLLACLQAAKNISSSGVCNLDTQSGAVYLFNGLTNLSSLTGNSASILVSAALLINQPIVLNQGTTIEGVPQVISSFQQESMANVQGNSYPMLYSGVFINGGSNGQMVIRRLKFTLNNNFQSAIVLDQNSDGGGLSGVKFEKDACLQQATITGSCVVIKGGFQYDFVYDAFQMAGGVWPVAPGVRFTNSSSAVVGSTNADQLAYDVNFFNSNFIGGAIDIDNQPGSSFSAVGIVGNQNYTFTNGIFESGLQPYLTQDGFQNFFGNVFALNGPQQSDTVTGSATPLIDATNATNVRNYSIQNCVSTGPLLVTSSNNSLGGANPYLLGNTGNIGNASNITSAGGIGTTVAHGGEVQATDTAAIGYVMPLPGAPTATGPTAGGSVPIGTWTYWVTAVDIDGHETVLGPASASITTTSGNQTITVTTPATFPVGAVGFNIYRSADTIPSDSQLVNANSCVFPQFGAVSATFTDTFGFTCGNSAPVFNRGLQTSLDQNGLTATAFRCFQQKKSANYTVTINDCNLEATAALTFTFPHSTRGQQWTIIDQTGVTTLAPDSGSICTGAGCFASVPMAAGKTAFVNCDGTNCFALIGP